MTASAPAPRLSTAPPAQRQSAAFSLSNPLAAVMAARRLYYGWVVAGATFLVMLATAGAMGAPGVIMLPLEKEFGWSAADISSALALRIALYGLIAPFAAAFINRFGVRPVVTTAVAMICFGTSSAVRNRWKLLCAHPEATAAQIARMKAMIAFHGLVLAFTLATCIDKSRGGPSGKCIGPTLPA